MIVPALTAWPAPVFIPSRCPTLSRPLRELPAPFLCAIGYSSVGVGGVPAGVVFFALAVAGLRELAAGRPPVDRSPLAGRSAAGCSAARSPVARMAPIRSSERGRGCLV